jgi:Holliday junction DNA helicase RuvA
MIAQLSGKFLVLTPTLLILDVEGVGYELHISLNTYAALQNKKEGAVHTYLKVSEDALTLFGFFNLEEKEMFIKLIGISGVGAATARMMLRSLRALRGLRGLLAFLLVRLFMPCRRWWLISPGRGANEPS